MHAVQQLQLELADARERGGTFADESCVSQENLKDVSQFGQSNGNQLDINGGGTSGGNTGAVPNGNSDDISSFASAGNASNQVAFVGCCGLIRSASSSNALHFGVVALLELFSIIGIC